MELNQNLKVFDETGMHGASEADIARSSELLKEVTALEMKWAAIKRDFQMGLVMEVKVVGETFEWLYFTWQGLARTRAIRSRVAKINCLGTSTTPTR